MTLTIGIISTCLGTEEFYHKCQRESELIENRLKTVRPNWRFKSYRAYVREFPNHINSCDGYVFSGSPVSVNAKDGWVADTLDYIRELYTARKSMIGICFGHQAIAKALGGQVELSPEGWSVGAVKVKFSGQRPWMQPWKEILRLYAVHNEQVVIPPKGSVVLGKTNACPIASFCIGNHVFTTQHHPEMTSEFLSSVVDHLSVELDTDIIHRAITSLGYGDDNDRFGEWMANFLESKDR